MGVPKAKWYVVLKGRFTGIYTDWESAKAQVEGFPQPVYKGFDSEKQALEAWNKQSFSIGNGPRQGTEKKEKPKGQFIVVDASSLGVPGPTEYQGFLMPEKKQLFSIQIGLATNNIGEFLGIVHALALCLKNGWKLSVYSDSVTALAWVRNQKVKSDLERSTRTHEAWGLVERALTWLYAHPGPHPIKKWETEFWGENPADYGRK
jgi:ribonuclease HI